MKGPESHLEGERVLGPGAQQGEAGGKSQAGCLAQRGEPGSGGLSRKRGLFPLGLTEK